jgi:DNA polymerase-3 subunit epsilon
MEDPFSLFEAPETPKPEERRSRPISDDQIGKIRRLLDRTGAVTQAARKAVVEEVLSRKVPELRNLSSFEAGRVIVHLSSLVTPEAKPAGSQRSAWDDREDDTWIDRL